MADTRPSAPTPQPVALPESGARPTLKTIATMTGLAVTTVSRALHDAPDIGEQTKRRVQEAADLLGYRPNRAGIRLRTGKTYAVSLVLATNHDLMNHTARLISAVAAGLRGTAYHLNVMPYFPDEDPLAPVRQIVETQAADVIILNQIEPEDTRVAWLMEQRFPFVTHGRSTWCADHAWFDFDNHVFGRIAAEQLIRRGRKSILMVAPKMRQNYAQVLVAGARDVCAEAGVRFDHMTEVTADDSSARIEEAVTHRLTEDPGIDGIITSSTTSCMAATVAAEDLGRVVGADIDLFSKEAIPFLHRFRRGILSVHEDVGTAGAFLARAALQSLTNPEKPPMQGLETPSFKPQV